jgi:integration host factor subunit beta
MNNTITKKILIDRIADSTGMKRVAVKQVVQEFLDQVIVELGEGNRLEFRDFGVFEVKQRAPRIAQNPKTLERVPVPAKRTVKFKVGRRMREAMDAELATKPAEGSVEAKPTTSTSSMREERDRDVVGSIRSQSSSHSTEAAVVR